MKMPYKHISKEGCRTIEKLTQDGCSNKIIAEVLGRARSTIGWELKRNYGNGARCYDHVRAQKLADKQRKESKVSKISEKTWQNVLELFKIETHV